VHLERGLDPLEVFPAHAGDLAGPADVGGDKLAAGDHGISVVERLNTRHIQFTVHGVTWKCCLLFRLIEDVPLSIKDYHTLPRAVLHSIAFTPKAVAGMLKC
jgi:hypothetical protein